MSFSKLVKVFNYSSLVFLTFFELVYVSMRQRQHVVQNTHIQSESTTSSSEASLEATNLYPNQ